MAAFIVDAQLPPGLARRLNAAGYDAVHIFDIAERGIADDKIVELALLRNAIIVSKDEDS